MYNWFTAETITPELAVEYFEKQVQELTKLLEAKGGRQYGRTRILRAIELHQMAVDALKEKVSRELPTGVFMCPTYTMDKDGNMRILSVDLCKENKL